MSTDEKTSPLVNQQLPQFVIDEGPQLIEFIKAYYEYAEQANNALEVSKNLKNYQDIDDTIPKYLEYLQREVIPSIPEDALANKQLFIKHCKDLYRARGSQKSYQLLFRILFGEEIEFYYPSVDMLRTSDGRWVADTSIRVGTPTTGDTDDFDNATIIGVTSGATAQVKKLETTVEGGQTVKELYLDNITGVFQDNEIVKEENNVTSGTILGTFGPMKAGLIRDGGAFHNPGDRVKFISAITGIGANGYISSTSGTDAVEFFVANSGSGYTTNSIISTTNPGNGIGAAFTIASLKDTEVIRVMTDVITPVANVVINTGPLFVSAGANTTALSANLAVANSGTFLNKAFAFTALSVGSVNAVTTTSYGNHYTLSKPQVAVENTEVSKLQLADGTGGIKGKNASILARYVAGAIANVVVDNSGTAYTRNEVTTITNLTTANTETATAYPQTSGVKVHEGGYTDTKGFISWNNKLQDNFYYQDFSYELKTNQFINTYRKIVEAILHPAGMKMFGRFRMEIDTGLPAPEIDDSAVGRITKESFITINIPAIVSGSSVQTIVESNTAVSLPDVIAVTDFSVSAASNTESVTTVFTQAAGNLFVAANNQLSTIRLSTLDSIRLRELRSFSSAFVTGNNTVFSTGETTFVLTGSPNANVGLSVLGSSSGANAEITFNSNTSMRVKGINNGPFTNETITVMLASGAPSVTTAVISSQSGPSRTVANNQTIMIVDQVGSTANGTYDINTVLTDTTMDLKVGYGDLSNGEFYTTANTTTITT